MLSVSVFCLSNENSVGQGNEGVDVKEGCLGTIIENNEIIMQLGEDEGGVFAVPTVAACWWKPWHVTRGKTVTRTNQSMKKMTALAIPVLSISVKLICERLSDVSEVIFFSGSPGVGELVNCGSGADAVAHSRRMFSGD